MHQATIEITDNREQFIVGESIRGIARLTLPVDEPLSVISLSFRCRGEVKWIDYRGSLRYLERSTLHDQHCFYDHEMKFTKKNVTIFSCALKKYVAIPFVFAIPKDRHLPSSMISKHGKIKYDICVTIKHNEDQKLFIKEVIVQSPFERGLMVTVGATADKFVFLHGGTVLMHASIDRKGFAPGESITVHITVDNRTNTKMVPRLSLNQIQIFTCEDRYKNVVNAVNEKPVIGTIEIGPHSKVEQSLQVGIPCDESLSIKSSLITVKYFVQVTLDIPHSFDLLLNLPVIITSRKVIDQFFGSKTLSEILNSQ